MIDDTPLQLSVTHYAAVGTNAVPTLSEYKCSSLNIERAVPKLSESNRFRSICDALVSGSPSPNYTIEWCICTVSRSNSGILCRSMVRDNLFKTKVGGGVYCSNLSTFDFSIIKLNRLFFDVTMTLLQNANSVQTLGILFRN